MRRHFLPAEELKTKNVIAGVSLSNPAGIGLPEEFGSRQIAYFREVGFKFGQWIDVGYWQLLL